MQLSSWRAQFALILAPWFLLNAIAWAAQDGDAIPTGTILVKGAWPSASDSATPLPEAGTISKDAYSNPYFGLTYALGPGWTQRYHGPPPSDGGYYVLAQMEPAADAHASNPDHILIAAQDLFFTSAPASNVLELMNYYKDRLAGDYKLTGAPVAVRIAGHRFVRLDYASQAAGLRWHVLATELRCHVVEFIITGPGAGAADRLTQSVNAMKLPSENSTPVCIKDYAAPENLIEREDPLLLEPRYNPVPVRILIDAEGRVKHVHFLSAYPEQARIISEALSHWRFKPYLANGHPVDVETGITFGRSSRAPASILQ